MRTGIVRTYWAWWVVLFSDIADAKTVREKENDERGRHEKGNGNWDLKMDTRPF